MALSAKSDIKNPLCVVLCFLEETVFCYYARFLRYEKGAKKGDPPVVNETQAALVRRIYRLFMQGQSA